MMMSFYSRQRLLILLTVLVAATTAAPIDDVPYVKLCDTDDLLKPDNCILGTFKEYNYCVQLAERDRRFFDTGSYVEVSREFSSCLHAKPVDADADSIANVLAREWRLSLHLP